jgi:hypothetical protein
MIISSLQEYSTIQHVEKENLLFLFLAYCWFMSVWVFWHVIGFLYLDSAGLMQLLYLHGSHGQACPEHMLQPGNAWLYIIFTSQVSDSLTLIWAPKSDTWLAKMGCTCAWTLLFGRILKIVMFESLNHEYSLLVQYMGECHLRSEWGCCNIHKP